MSATSTPPGVAVASAPAVSLRGASLAYGPRTLWDGLDLDIAPGEFLAVLGANGSGKTSFLKVLLGLVPLGAGTLAIDGEPARRGSRAIGYVPQQKHFPPDTPLRARDLVGLGVDGHKWGIRLRGRAYRKRVDALLAEVGAASYAKIPVGMLSGGEQQRLRIAQALAPNPKVLLCDEPLLSLDLHHQRAVSALVGRQAKRNGTAVVFVTHEINPILEHVDRVLYLAGGRFTIGTPGEVMTTEVLSRLYGTHVEVLHSHGRIAVVGMPDRVLDGHPEELPGAELQGQP
ncbi:zinc/manganese transport system ATP-binding protein [Arthrobacter silviterrae]|uniref:ABC transporter ATP-binding protein n=1 Tax=Arthrobacter silviterrae TaxID=2026658 RepID=A0ABX0D7C1_9MICC|nr:MULTISPECIES: ABC transporter ATP-binding protein [Arthrobacter]MCU6482473.1 ABC transporter ATP-binding protein [Arthrobacter sp. A2-55]MDQ0276995.1 zinc/manganese transport system ATP-binding protein [Arthrobacter silviterrae]NGN82783.1 ABC transporter ATP-binding protein [Arthrobacter silviterrae]